MLKPCISLPSFAYCLLLSWYLYADHTYLQELNLGKTCCLGSDEINCIVSWNSTGLTCPLSMWGHKEQMASVNQEKSPHKTLNFRSPWYQKSHPLEPLSFVSDPLCIILLQQSKWTETVKSLICATCELKISIAFWLLTFIMIKMDFHTKAS